MVIKNLFPFCPISFGTVMPTGFTLVMVKTPVQTQVAAIFISNILVVERSIAAIIF